MPTDRLVLLLTVLPDKVFVREFFQPGRLCAAARRAALVNGEAPLAQLLLVALIDAQQDVPHGGHIIIDRPWRDPARAQREVAVLCRRLGIPIQLG